MFTLYHSNQLDLLKELLVNRIRQAPLSHPFQREQILVQSPGMAQWLKLELAKAFGIAANIDFPLPASFIWEMFTQVLADVPRQSPYNKGSMSWQLMTILPALLERPAFAPLAAYLGGAEEQDPQADPRQEPETGAAVAAVPEDRGSVRPVSGLPAGLDRPLGRG
nr:exodeoxyribonuclease V subunit gamma [Aeromonas encheleia]